MAQEINAIIQGLGGYLKINWLNTRLTYKETKTTANKTYSIRTTITNSNAVTSMSGQAPAVYHNDHSDPERPKVRTLKEELNRVIRSRLLNPKWIEGMR